jgi:hypothetical protein
MHQQVINTLGNQETGFSNKMFDFKLLRYEKSLNKWEKAIGD